MHACRKIAHVGQAPIYLSLPLSDVDMPHVNGLTFIESVFKKGCHCRKLALISGKGLDSAELNMIAKFGARFFPKPLLVDEFNSWMVT